MPASDHLPLRPFAPGRAGPSPATASAVPAPLSPEVANIRLRPSSTGHGSECVRLENAHAIPLLWWYLQ